MSRQVITSFKFREHKTLEEAQAELARLKEANPDKKFRIYLVNKIQEPDEPPRGG